MAANTYAAGPQQRVPSGVQLSTVKLELEQRHQIADRRSVGRNIRIGTAGDRVREGALCRFCKLRSRAAVTIDDTLGQQIVYFGARFRPVGAEKVVEADVLSNDDDQVLDRRR